MRSTSLSFLRCLGFVALGAALGAPLACGSTSADLAFGNDTGGSGAGTEDPTPGENTRFSEDGSTAKAAPYRGNPLCHVLQYNCMPDDDGTQHATGTIECATSTTDAGGDGGGGITKTGSACRLRRDDSSSVSPTCIAPKTADVGGDGAACKTGDDCAPGLDCVESDTGSFCRRYCCLGSCGAPSGNGGATFCDVEKLVDANYVAPVCMPLKRCTLLKPGECTDTETCAVVSENGDTGCVPIGSAQKGQSCDDTHCAVGLTCLGQAGNRKCYQLCRPADADCGPTESCKTTSAFKDSAFGVCE